VTGVRDHEQLHAGLLRRVQAEELVVRDLALAVDVVRADALVGAVGLVAVLVRHIRAVPRVLDHDEVAARGLDEGALDRSADALPGGLLVQQLADGEALAPQRRGPVVRIVHAAGQIAPGAGIVVDADAEREFVHARLLREDLADLGESVSESDRPLDHGGDLLATVVAQEGCCPLEDRTHARPVLEMASLRDRRGRSAMRL
jgi:hypothetical protein